MRRQPNGVEGPTPVKDAIGLSNILTLAPE